MGFKGDTSSSSKKVEVKTTTIPTDLNVKKRILSVRGLDISRLIVLLEEL